MPNLIKETAFLKDRTCPKNFQILEKKHNKAKIKFVKEQAEVKIERKKMAQEKIRQLNLTAYTEKELK